MPADHSAEISAIAKSLYDFEFPYVKQLSLPKRVDALIHTCETQASEIASLKEALERQKNAYVLHIAAFGDALAKAQAALNIE